MSVTYTESNSNYRQVGEEILSHFVSIATEWDPEQNSIKELNENLAKVVSLTQTFYKACFPHFTLRDLDAAKLNDAAAILSNNKWVVDYITTRFLRYESATEYEASPAIAKAINDILFLVVRCSLKMSSETARDVKEYCDLVRKDLSVQPYPKGYTVSTRWADISRRLLNLVGYLEDPLHIAILGMHGSPFYTYVELTNKATEEIFIRERNRIDKLDNELSGIGESELNLPGTYVEVDGRTMTAGLCQCFSFYSNITSKLDDQAKLDVILEIGSGYGRLARVFRLATKNRCYLLVDLAESLIFAYAFLKANFPDASFHVIKSKEDVTEDMIKRYDFIFCSVQRFGDLQIGSVDLLINTWSFGEMPQSCIDFLLDVVHTKVTPSYFFSLNPFLQDRNLHYSSNMTSELQEGNEIILKMKPMWWPLHNDITSTAYPHGDRGIVYDNSAATMLKRVEEDSESLTKRITLAALDLPLGSPAWLKYAFFATLWTENPAVIEDFFVGFKRWADMIGVSRNKSFDFEKVGEIRYLKRRLTALKENPAPAPYLNGGTVDGLPI